MKEIKNVIIQAGGSGTRLGRHTSNKPKCLVEIDGKTLLQMQLEIHSGKRVVVIGDYKIDVLRKYVKTFLSKHDVRIVDASGNKGTLSGLKDAITEIDPEEPILLVWSDLLFQKSIDTHRGDIQVMVTDEFPCRYFLSDSLEIVKETTSKNGIIGSFTFKNKSVLKDIEESGSLVGDWMTNVLGNFDIVRTKMTGVREVGEISHLQKNSSDITCRFFNNISVANGLVKKSCIDNDYLDVIENEKNWYKHVLKHGFNRIPDIKSYEPFVMEFINGTHGHRSGTKWSNDEKKQIFRNICDTLTELHSLERIKASKSDVRDMYLHKTLERVNSVRDLIPFLNEDTLIINGNECANPFSKNRYEHFKEKVSNIDVESFCIVHGDPTFNNFLIKDNKSIVLYDPRGSFSSTKVYGDPDYDWAKLFYSMIGNYDSVNDKNFEIRYKGSEISYSMESNGWEFLEEDFFKISKTNPETINLLNCLIWFSLCGYVRDYDSVLMSYVRGVELWQK